MSLTHLCLSIAALSPELSASLLSGLLAAVPVLAGETDPQRRKALLVQQMEELRPRDMEEAMLASQLLAALHGANACFGALDGLDPVSPEASRLRRDALAMQRNALAMHRALRQSQTRPMQEDAAGELRPTVPVKPATPPRGKPAAKENPPAAAVAAAADDAGAAVAAAAPAPYDPFNGNASLIRLNQKWGKLKRWEEMTMEERRETFGYGEKSSRAAVANGGGTTKPAG